MICRCCDTGIASLSTCVTPEVGNITLEQFRDSSVVSQHSLEGKDTIVLPVMCGIQVAVNTT